MNLFREIRVTWRSESLKSMWLRSESLRDIILRNESLGNESLRNISLRNIVLIRKRLGRGWPRDERFGSIMLGDLRERRQGGQDWAHMLCKRAEPSICFPAQCIFSSLLTLQFVAQLFIFLALASAILLSSLDLLIMFTLPKIVRPFDDVDDS